MRIVPYEGNLRLEDIESLSILIKAVPFEDSFAPAFVLISPDEDHAITIEEAACLMDGIEIANERIDDLISFILQNNMGYQVDQEDNYEQEFDEDDLGKGD
jgi:hypothetical protein